MDEEAARIKERLGENMEKSGWTIKGLVESPTKGQINEKTSSLNLDQIRRTVFES